MNPEGSSKWRNHPLYHDRHRRRPLRADARRNREALLQAAVELFAEEGTDVWLNAVAARAGVGIGTLYRNFPNRDALVEAAYRNEVAALCDAAAELLAELSADVGAGRVDGPLRHLHRRQARDGRRAEGGQGQGDLY